MTVRTVSNLPAAAHGETVRCLFAIELSKQSWIIGFITPLSTRIGRRTLSGGDWKGLLKLIDEVRGRVSGEMGRTVEVMSCYEAGYDGFWLHRQLEEHGVRNFVIDPASLQVDRRKRRVKTDRIDTERLLRPLMAYLRGEPKVWSVVRVPSVAEEDALISERVQHVKRIKGLCALQGHRSVTVQHHTEEGKRMKLVPTFVVVCVQRAQPTCAQIHFTGAAEEFSVKHNGRVLEYAARAVEE
jgi:transposase